MANSTTMIADVTTVITNGPNGATTAKAIAASGVIMDYSGNMNLVLLKLQETQQLLAMLIANTDSTDSANLALLQGIQNNLV